MEVMGGMGERKTEGGWRSGEGVEDIDFRHVRVS